MAKSLVTDSGTLYIPGAYSKYQVVSNPSGLATTGVLMLVGEAEGGPDWTLESDLEANAYGPDQLADVAAKYKSGPLVDAFRLACAPANDPDISGAMNRCVIVKTNVADKASAALGAYGTLYDKGYGKSGNQISWQVLSQAAESLPTTGSFTWIPNVGTVEYGIRVNGGASVGGTLSANQSPAQVKTTLDGLTAVAASGGTDRDLIDFSISNTLTVDQNPSGLPHSYNIKVTRSVAWKTTPTVGDTLVIPEGSVIAGASNVNVGAYVILAVTSTEITARKLSDAGKTTPAAVAGTITTPADVTAIAEAADTDIQAFAPVTVTLEAGAIIDGVGKSLEFAEKTGGADLLSRYAFTLSPTAVTWVSKSGSAKLITSSSETRVKLSLNRSSDAISEEHISGGEIALKVSYSGTTATLTSTDTLLTTAVTGGSGANLSIALNDYSNIQGLVDFINSQTGYSAAVGTAALGLLPCSALDNISAQGMASEFGAQNLRIKIDAYRFYRELNENSSLCQLGNPAEQAASGLPAVTAAVAFLAGGTRGGSSDAQIVAAIDALQKVQGNFLVPLFSRDAALDISDGFTDASSAYSIAAVHAAAKSHVLAMSTYKRRRNRQALLSIADSFENQKNTAANTASFRCLMAFQDNKQIGGDGSVQQFLPWMTAVQAAAMQAAGFYRSVEFKGMNTSGVLSRAGDFDDRSDSQLEDALKAGLLPAKRALTGGFVFASDQTTYGKDNNFVFNSLQAVYAADTVSLTTAQRMETAFVGQSVADISAAVAMSFLEGIMGDMLRLKLIAPSDDALKGFKNAKVRISGNAMLVSLEIKLATAIDFITIDFLVSPVQQNAGR